MAHVDCSRWTTRLTASYLATTAALIAILGNTVPGRVWLVAGHLGLSASLLSLNGAWAPPFSGHFFFDLVHRVWSHDALRLS
jgi:hypothetical protein